MAVKKAAKPATTAVVKWDEALAKEAEIAASMEASTGGGQFFSTRGGILSWQDAPLPQNQMAVIILDSILENVFYEDKFDPDNPAAPICFAFGRDEKTLKPHKLVFEASNQQHDFCQGCAQNEWGSADVGRGKACRNTRRLAMIPAGTLDAQGRLSPIEDPEHYEAAQVGYMKLPVTSVKGYASFVKQLAGTLKRPPYGVVTRVRVEPDPKNQFRVVFEPLAKVADALMPLIMRRHEETMAVIDFPYVPFEAAADEAPTKRVPTKRVPPKAAPAAKGRRF